MTDAIVLRTPLVARLMLGLFVVASVAMTVAGRDRAMMAACAVTFGLLFALSMNRWVVDFAGLEKRFPLQRRDSVVWRDVLSVGVAPRTGNLVFTRAHKGPLEVSLRLAGASEMCRLVLAHAPPAALTESLKKTLGDRAAEVLAVPLETVVPVDVADVFATRDDASARLRDNPFFVLGLPPECSRADVERTGQKLLALLAIDSAGARRYATPLGDATRTADGVRLAMSELRNPDRRLVHELWAHAGPRPTVGPPRRDLTPTDASLAPWNGSMRAIGWRRL